MTVFIADVKQKSPAKFSIYEESIGKYMNNFFFQLYTDLYVSEGPEHDLSIFR